MIKRFYPCLVYTILIFAIIGIGPAISAYFVKSKIGKAVHCVLGLPGFGLSVLFSSFVRAAYGMDYLRAGQYLVEATGYIPVS